MIEIFTGRDKEAAAAARARWEALADRAELGCVAAGAPAMLFGQAAQAIEVALLAVMVGGRRLARASARLAADPPRADFERRTRAGRGLDPAVFAGRSEIERRGGELASALSSAAVFLRALILAGERAAGAVNAGELSYARDRLEESIRFASLSADAMEAAEHHARELESELEGHLAGLVDGFSEPWVRERRALRLDEQVSDYALALLFRSGVRIEELRRVVRISPQHMADLQRPIWPAEEAAVVAEQLRDLSLRLTEQLRWL